MSWLERQSFLGEDSDQALAALTVGLVGLGGGGSHVAQQLAHVGIGNFVLIDDDEIADTNLNRLVGATKEDVRKGTLKIDIAERVIHAVNPGAKVDKHCARWQVAAEALKLCDVVIGGVDNVRSKHELDGFTRRFMIPYIDMGMDVTRLGEDDHLISGQVVLTGPGEPCLQCLGIVRPSDLEREAQAYGAAGGKPQVVWPNGVLASAAVGLFIQLVTPWKGNTRASAFLEYDGNLHTIREARALSLALSRPCPHYRTSDVGDPLFDLRKMRDPESYAKAVVKPKAPTLWQRFLNAIRSKLLHRSR